MRKVMFTLYLSSIFVSTASAQKVGCPSTASPVESTIDQTFHFSFGRTKNHIAITSLGTMSINENTSVFFGANVTPSTGRNQNEKNYPFRALRDSYVGGYAGLTMPITNDIKMGIGIEVQQTTKKFAVPDGGENILRVCPRFFSQGTIGGTDFLLTCNALGRLFDCWGYCSTAISDKVGIGIYANTSCTGIGPLIKWGFAKSENRPFGIAVGYNPHSNERGIVLMAQNF